MLNMDGKGITKGMIGQTLDGRYQVVRPLGTGGFGQTYIAEDTRRPGHPLCVVKVLHPASSDPQFLEVARRLFQNEADTLEKLGHHPQIPRLLAFFEQDKDFYLVQELVDGTPLTEELGRGQRWSESRVRSLVSEILELLVFIHGQGVIHRDIKPDNIIRRHGDRKLVLVDFGSVKQVRDQSLVTDGPTSFTVVVGTPGYMASEQSQGKPRASSDLYSLGIIGIQAVTGISPAQFKEDIDGELIWQDQANVSDAFAQVLTKMVRPYFKLRYPTAQEALQALQGIDGATPLPQSPTLAAPSVAAAEPGSASPHPSTFFPTQVVASPPAARSSGNGLGASPPPASPVVAAPKRFGCASWFAGLGAMILVLGLGLVGLSFLGLTQNLFPFLTPTVTPADNGATLLAQAREVARRTGNLEDAISLAEKVPNHSNSAEAVQTQIQQWQIQWQRQQDLYKRAKAAFDAERWHTARDLAFQLPQNPYWNQRANPLYFAAKRKIAELERPSSPPTPTPSEPPEPTLEPIPSPSSNPEPTPVEPDEPTLLPSPAPTPLPSPILIPVPTPTPPSPN
jgi:serine/threonine-protein kinase